MTALRIAICVVVCSSLSAVVLANPSSSPATSDPQAVALVQKSLAALTNGVQVTDVTLTGTARRIAGSDDETGTATLKATSAGDSRVKLSFASGNRIQIRNHAAMPLQSTLPAKLPASATMMAQPTGEWIGLHGKAHGMASHNTMTTAAWFFPALTLEKLASSQNYVLSYGGQVTRDGQAVLEVSAWKSFANVVKNSPNTANSNSPSATLVGMMSPARVQALLQHLSRMELYFDPSSSLPVALAFDTHPDNNALVDIPVEIRFSGYQTVRGVLAPMHVQKFINNGLVLDLHFTSATVNSGLSTSVFAIQ